MNFEEIKSFEERVIIEFERLWLDGAHAFFFYYLSNNLYLFPFPLFRFQDAKDLTPSSIQPAVSFGFSVPVASNNESTIVGRVALRDCELCVALPDCELRFESKLPFDESEFELPPEKDRLLC